MPDFKVRDEVFVRAEVIDVDFDSGVGLKIATHENGRHWGASCFPEILHRVPTRSEVMAKLSEAETRYINDDTNKILQEFYINSLIEILPIREEK